MGVGFVIGGYCPGTSFCGAAVGRIDAMLFVLGGLIGAFAFGEAFPRVQDVYAAWSLGDLTLPAALGVSPGIVAIAWALVATTAFAITGRIERRVNPASGVFRLPVTRHRAAAVALIAASIAVAWLGRREERWLAQVSRAEYRRAHTVRHMSADEVAFRILDEDERLQLIDTRPAAQFSAFSLPRAVNIPVGELFGKTWRDGLARARDLKVFFGDDEREATTAALLAERLGYGNVAVLDGGLRTFRADILGPTPARALRIDQDTEVFRASAGPRIAALIKARGAAKAVERKVKKVAGGCGV